MKHRNLLRQLKDIQNQADQLLKGKPGIVEVQNFIKYSDELKKYLENEVDLEEMNYLIKDIPTINIDAMMPKTWIVAFTPSIFSSFFYERRIVDQALTDIDIAKSKYASIEFIMKNNAE